MTMKTLIDAVADRTGETKARTAVTVEMPNRDGFIVRFPDAM